MGVNDIIEELRRRINGGGKSLLDYAKLYDTAKELQNQINEHNKAKSIVDTMNVNPIIEGLTEQFGENSAKLLTIKNIQKIWGRQLYSKWIPGTYGWAVASVEDKNDRYFFELRSNGKFKHAEIQLRREPFWFEGEIKYEMWAWNLENNRAEQMWFSKQELDTMEGMAMRLGVMLKKIIPKG